MQQLQFVDLDEGGRLVVASEDGERFAVLVDDRLRAALRARPTAPTPERSASSVSPRDVQAMIRAGLTAEEVASSTGWEIERVRRFEGPVIAEREHVVGLAQRAPVRSQGRTDGSHTLDRRVRERLQGRDVDLTSIAWDAARHEAHGPWTVLVAFTAGGRERRATWHYDVQGRAVEALDDEARWLSEDEQALPGGLAGNPLLAPSHGEDEAAADLMATMRERRQRRSRRPRKETTDTPPGHVPGQQRMPDELLPIDDLQDDRDEADDELSAQDPSALDPSTQDPPAAHPRGSAAESPAPVGPGTDNVDASTLQAPGTDAPKVTDATDTGDDSDDGWKADEDTAAELELDDDAAKGTKPSGAPEPAPRPERKPKRSRERRRLRMPKLPPAVGEPEEVEHEPEGSFARTRHDPNEVSFDEFFGTDEDDLVEDGIVDLTEEDLGDDAFGDATTGDDLVEVTSDGDPGTDAVAADAVALDAAVDDADVLADDAEANAAGVDDATADAEPAEEDASEVDTPDDSATSASDEGPGDELAGTPGDGESKPDSAQKRGGDRAQADAPATTEKTSSPPKPTPPRKGRTSVPSWDDIMFGSKDRG